MSQRPRSFEHWLSSLPSRAGLICSAFIAMPHLNDTQLRVERFTREGRRLGFRAHDPRLGRSRRSQRSRASSRCRAARPTWPWRDIHRGRRERAGSGPSALGSSTHAKVR